MVQYDLRNGGGKGYVAGFCSFLRDLVKTSNTSSHEPESEPQPNLNFFEGVDVDYTDQNVAHQIENRCTSLFELYCSRYEGFFTSRIGH